MWLQIHQAAMQKYSAFFKQISTVLRYESEQVINETQIPIDRELKLVQSLHTLHMI